MSATTRLAREAGGLHARYASSGAGDDTRYATSAGYSRTNAQTCVVEHVTSELARDFGEQITLRDMENASGYSVYQIIRAFRRRVGTTPHAYLMRMRIHYAARRLVQGDSIAGAAAEAGFADQSHMTRHFKRIFGMTPRQYLLLQREVAALRPQKTVLF